MLLLANHRFHKSMELTLDSFLDLSMMHLDALMLALFNKLRALQLGALTPLTIIE